MDDRHLRQSFTQSLLSDYEMEEAEISRSSSGFQNTTQDSYVSKDLLKSATIENLISQNEELMSRQKVTLRRLATLEDLNQELQDENFRQKNQILNYADQVQVLKEKDAAWKNKVDELELEKDKLLQIAKEYEKNQIELDRFRKYHDKIKFQVKPYIQSLKDLRDQAQQNLETVQNQLHLKETQIKEMRQQMQEVLRQSKTQMDEMQKQTHGVIEQFESQMKALQEDKAHFERSYIEFKSKLQQSQQALEKKTELENKNIELERSKQDLKLQLESEINRLQSKSQDLEQTRTRFEIENADLKNHIQDQHSQILKLEEDLIQLKRQMESLRFMWNQKNDEAERQKASLEALEKLNYSLSQKIEELRESHSESQSQINSIDSELKSDYQLV